MCHECLGQSGVWTSLDGELCTAFDISSFRHCLIWTVCVRLSVWICLWETFRIGLWMWDCLCETVFVRLGLTVWKWLSGTVCVVLFFVRMPVWDLLCETVYVRLTGRKELRESREDSMSLLCLADKDQQLVGNVLCFYFKGCVVSCTLRSWLHEI